MALPAIAFNLPLPVGEKKMARLYPANQPGN